MHNKNTLFKIDCEQCWRDLCKMLLIPVLAILGIVILCVFVSNRDEKPKTHSPGGIIPAQPENKAGIIPVLCTTEFHLAALDF